MIILELDRLNRRGRPCEAELAACVCADGNDLSVDGPEPDLIHTNQPVVSLRHGRTVTCADDPEEWVRGLAVSFRTPYLAARIVEDTSPPRDIEIERANVREPVSS